MSVEEYPPSHGSLAGLSDSDHHLQYPLLAQSTLAARPTGPWRFGRIHRATDTGDLAFDTGAAWTSFGGTARLDTAQTWTGKQSFSSAAGYTGEIMEVRLSAGRSYPSFHVNDTGMTVMYDGAFIVPFSATSIGLQIDWNTNQTGDLLRVYAAPTSGDVGLRVTGRGEVSTGGTSTGAGYHMALNQIMSS